MCQPHIYTTNQRIECHTKVFHFHKFYYLPLNSGFVQRQPSRFNNPSEKSSFSLLSLLISPLADSFAPMFGCLFLSRSISFSISHTTSPLFSLSHHIHLSFLPLLICFHHSTWMSIRKVEECNLCSKRLRVNKRY